MCFEATFARCILKLILILIWHYSAWRWSTFALIRHNSRSSSKQRFIEADIVRFSTANRRWRWIHPNEKCRRRRIRSWWWSVIILMQNQINNQCQWLRVNKQIKCTRQNNALLFQGCHLMKSKKRKIHQKMRKKAEARTEKAGKKRKRTFLPAFWILHSFMMQMSVWMKIILGSTSILCDFYRFRFI